MAEGSALFPVETVPVLEDRPITSEAEDRLDRSTFIAGLIRALVVDERDSDGALLGRRSTNYVVGLTGPWGSGKSSIINLLNLKLGAMDRVLVTTLNPWLFNGRDELLSAFFSSLRSALGKSRRERMTDAIDALDRYQQAIGIAAQVAAAYTDLHGTAGKATGWVKSARANLSALIKKQRELSPSEERASLERKIATSCQAIVVLIDELDRVEDSEVKAVAQLIKAVGDIRGISYLVAYDPQRVIDALGRGSGQERIVSGEAYLEKIIQHPIPLRPLLQDDVKTLLDMCLSAEQIRLPEVGDQNGNEILDHIIRSITTPREVKRLVGAYAIINRMTREELYAYDVLAYCWIITKTPTLRDQIINQSFRLVEDPPSDEDAIAAIFEDQKDGGKSPEQVLGSSAAQHDRLLRLIFPAFGAVPGNEQAGDRISKRRNLVRLLYLGDPPGSVNRDDVHSALSQGRDEATKSLHWMLQRGTLATFLDKVADSTELLPDDQSDSLWTGLAANLVRAEDWLSAPDPRRSLADDAQEMLLNLGKRGSVGQKRAKHVVELLIAEGDLVIVPGFLRRHMFQHGLAVGQAARGGRSTLDKAETESLLRRELPRYRQAVTSGFALRRLPDVEAIFVISNAGEWGSELRATLTEQLASPEAIQTIAGLFVPPGWTMSPKSMDELLDRAAVLARLKEFQQEDAFAADPWIRASLSRFRITLEGGDPMFADRDRD